MMDTINQPEPIMRRLLLGLLALLASAFLSTASATKPANSAPNVAGHYYLSGMTEVGSELLLKPSGEFDWMLAYGAQDMVARGRWAWNGNTVVLTTSGNAKGAFRLFEEDELHVKKEPKAGSWVAIVGVPRTGPIEGVEVQFVARSGKTATAVSQPNGDAIVSMPAGEQWVRSGLRRAGGKDEWVWIDVPPARAAARIAGFAVTNWQEFIKPPFETLELRLEDGKLVVADNPMGLRGTYSKP